MCPYLMWLFLSLTFRQDLAFCTTTEKRKGSTNSVKPGNSMGSTSLQLLPYFAFAPLLHAHPTHLVRLILVVSHDFTSFIQPDESHKTRIPIKVEVVSYADAPLSSYKQARGPFVLNTMRVNRRSYEFCGWRRNFSEIVIIALFEFLRSNKMKAKARSLAFVDTANGASP